MVECPQAVWVEWVEWVFKVTATTKSFTTTHKLDFVQKKPRFSGVFVYINFWLSLFSGFNLNFLSFLFLRYGYRHL